MVKNRKIGNFQNRKISKPDPNRGANERPKGESVAVGDLKASLVNGNLKTSKDVSSLPVLRLTLALKDVQVISFDYFGNVFHFCPK